MTLGPIDNHGWANGGQTVSRLDCIMLLKLGAAEVCALGAFLLRISL